ncbi:MAG: GTPase Era [Candidatus Sumerlaeaceae bacterium]|nr:GTPase Era [Candidatus Sumerlaeaceae bacterium]
MQDQLAAVSPPGFKSGFVAILGKPNAGKSTLLNALVGERLSIVSEKPQTTRDRIAGILTTEQHQIVFLDTPGIIVPRDKFNEALVDRVDEAIEDADVLYHLVDAMDTDPPNERLREALQQANVRARFLVLNKIDKLAPKDAESIPPGVDVRSYDRVFRISALLKQGLDELLSATVDCLSEGPLYYDPDQLTDRDERFFAAEAVREKIFLYTGEEIPYAVFTKVESFEERPDKDFIRVVIYVERESQKPIIIGKGGQLLKRIGTEARCDIEKLTGRPTYLELWVKVRKNWRKNESDLRNFGFKTRPKKR